MARLADLLSFPPLEELNNVEENKHPLLDFLKNREGNQLDTQASNDSRTFRSKFATLMDYLVWSLRIAWGGRDQAECTSKMGKMSEMLCNGIELM